MYLLQVWFDLSDEATEDAIYDSYAMKRFRRMSFTNETVPDATTLGNFRHMMEENNLTEKIFGDVRSRLDRAVILSRMIDTFFTRNFQAALAIGFCVAK